MATTQLLTCLYLESMSTKRDKKQINQQTRTPVDFLYLAGFIPNFSSRSNILYLYNTIQYNTLAGSVLRDRPAKHYNIRLKSHK